MPVGPKLTREETRALIGNGRVVFGLKRPTSFGKSSTQPKEESPKEEAMNKEREDKDSD